MRSMTPNEVLVGLAARIVKDRNTMSRSYDNIDINIF